jgi:23S rRNA pseudouridine2605 synthase
MLQRVQKIISNYGYCSRRKAEELISEGLVKVNNKTISLGDKALLSDQIKINDKIIKKSKPVYLMLNKPKRCVTALKDEQYKTVIDIIDYPLRVIPIGRLDFNTTGLLLLTNDGDFANKVMHPRYEIKKTYQAKINQPLSSETKLILEKGVMLSDGTTKPAKVDVIDKDLINITIHEGRNRIIKRMLKKLGYQTLELKRVRIGNLSLGDLKSGEFRKLSKEEIKEFL